MSYLLTNIKILAAIGSLVTVINLNVKYRFSMSNILFSCSAKIFLKKICNSKDGALYHLS
jgi:hypothetical protein